MGIQRTSTGRMRLAVLGALVVVPLVAACGDGTAPAGAQRSLTVSDLQQREYFYQGDYLGRTVTVSAKVADVLAPQVFELSGGDFVRWARQLIDLLDQLAKVADEPVAGVARAAVGRFRRGVVAVAVTG